MEIAGASTPGSRTAEKHRPGQDFHRVATLLSDLFCLWILLHYGFGGVLQALPLLRAAGWIGWPLFGLVVFLLLYRSDYRRDLPLLLAGYALGYWGEWWGTTRGVWTYWNNAQPPDYLPPLWAVGLITVVRLAGLLRPWLVRLWQRRPSPFLRRLAVASFALLPLAALLVRLPLLARYDWSQRLDGHFFAGLVVGALLVTWRFELRRALPVYLCGMLLGGLYEALGTWIHEWTYLTGEIPPLWIIPLWGLAAVAMERLADQLGAGIGWMVQCVHARRVRPDALLQRRRDPARSAGQPERADAG